jgi:DNA-binding PadR family transcriptional regulator
MSIQYAILGLLSEGPLSGYDLKKIISESETLYWSGNNNQIYRPLVALYEQGLVTKQVEPQEDLPDRKIYHITAEGQEALKTWLLSAPEPPDLKQHFLIRLMWADQLAPAELADLLDRYQAEIQDRLLMHQEKQKRDNRQAESRQGNLRRLIHENWFGFYRHELDWLNQLRKELNTPYKD